MPSYVHPTALIDPGVVLGEGVHVSAWAHLCSGTVVGDRCYIGHSVYLGSDVTVEDDAWIGHNVVIRGAAVIGKRAVCSHNVVFSELGREDVGVPTLSSPHAPTLLGAGAYVGPNATLARGVHIAEQSVIPPNTYVDQHLQEPACRTSS